MKKLLSMPLALTLVLAASTSVFAADINQNSTQQKADTTVTFKVDPAYTVTIPANVTLDQKTGTDGTITYEKDLTVSASDVRLLEGKKVQVTLESSFKLTTGEQGAQYELPYTVKVGTPVQQSQTETLLPTLQPSIPTSGPAPCILRQKIQRMPVIIKIP